MQAFCLKRVLKSRTGGAVGIRFVERRPRRAQGFFGLFPAPNAFGAGLVRCTPLACGTGLHASLPKKCPNSRAETLAQRYNCQKPMRGRDTEGRGVRADSAHQGTRCPPGKSPGRVAPDMARRRSFLCAHLANTVGSAPEIDPAFLEARIMSLEPSREIVPVTRRLG